MVKKSKILNKSINVDDITDKKYDHAPIHFYNTTSDYGELSNFWEY